MSQQWLPTGIAGKSRNLEAFRSRARGMPERFQGYRNIDELSRPSLLEFAGAQSGTVRQEQTRPEFEARMAAAQSIEGIEAEKPAPALQRFLDFINRGSSAFVGAYTGLTGAERLEGARPGLEAEGFLPDENIFQAAARRFGEGLSGEEQFRFVDFGALGRAKAEGEELSRGRRAWEVGKGFVIDTALDPLTYVSFGGSIMGRKLGSEAVLGMTQRAFRNGASVINFESMVRDGIRIRATREELLAQRLNSIVDDSIRNLDEAGNAEKLKNILQAVQNRYRFDPTDDLDTILRKVRSYDIAADGGTKTFSLSQAYILRDAPEYAATYYLRRGAGGLRRWARKNMGEEAGEAYFRSLPKDIQGGIRIRAPFLRRADGTPYAVGIPGIGAARLSDKFKTVENVWLKTERFRDLLRSRYGQLPARYFSGQHGEILWSVATGMVKRPRGAASVSRAASYADYTRMLQINRMALVDERNMSRIVKNEHLEASNMYTVGLEKYGDKFVRQFREMFFDASRMADAKKYLDEVGNRTLRPDTFAAYLAAKKWREMLDDLGDEIVDTFNGDGEQIAFFIKDYVPRIATEQEMRRRARRYGPRALAGFPKYTKHRTSFAQAWRIRDDGGAVALEWMPLDKLNELYSQFYGVDAIYKLDPREFMGIYLAEVRASLIDQKVLNEFRRSGVLTRLSPDKLPMAVEVNPTIVVQRTEEALGGVDDAGTTGWMEDLRQRLMNEYGGGKGGRGRPMTLDRAERMAEYLRDGGGTGRFRFNAMSRAEVDNYRFTGQNDDGDFIWRNSADGSEIVLFGADLGTPTVSIRVNGRMIEEGGVVKRFSPDVAVMRATGSDTMRGVTRGIPSESDIFGRKDIESAVRKAQDYMTTGAGSRFEVPEVGRTIRVIRNDYYVNRMYELRSEILRESEEFLEKNPRVVLELLGREALEGIPPEQRGDYVQAVVRKLNNWLDFFGAAEPVARTTRGGMATLERTGTERLVPMLPPRYEKMIERLQLVDPGLRNVEGQYAATGLLRRRMEPARLKDSIARQMNTDFAPEAVMRSIRKYFEAYEKPQGIGQVLWEEVYQPFYAMQKVGMTLFRGFGFIGRNVNGGMWNNFLNDVGRQDHMASGRLIVMQARARQNVKRSMGEEFSRMPETAAQRVEEELHRMIRSTFKGKNAFLPDMSDADALIELHKLFYYNALGSDRAMNRITGEVMQRARSLQRGGGRVVEVPTINSEGKMVVERVRSSGAGPEGLLIEGVEEEGGRIAKSVEWLTFENPWIKHVMSPMSEASEDYLRLAAFLKGAREVGLEAPESGVRGFGASLWVKATQFDYADLSDFERNVLKNIIPFYTWTRYNVPLQVRALISKPGRILQAERIQQGLADMFGDETAGPLPGYLKNLFGFEIPEDSFTWLPEMLRPSGNVGVGLIWGEPIADLSRWFKVPGRAGASPINWQEAAMNLNPAFRAVGSVIAGLEGDPSVSLVNQEEAPGWLKWLPEAVPGIELDPQTGEKTVSRYTTEVVRAIVPQISVLERNIPWLFGNERQKGRAFGAITSSMLGLPTSTVDDWIRSSEQERLRDYVADQMDVMFGESSADRMYLIRQLVEEGAPVEFIAQLDVANMPDEMVDTGQAIGAWRIMKQVLVAKSMGVPEEDIAASLSGLIPLGTPADEWVDYLMENLDVPTSDRNKFVRQFGRRRATPEDLERLGITQEDVRNMSDEELRLLVMLVNDEVPF